MPIQNVVEAYGNNLIGKHIKGGGGSGINNIRKLDYANAQVLTSSMMTNNATFTLPKDGKIIINIDHNAGSASTPDHYYTVQSTNLGATIFYFRNPQAYGGMSAVVELEAEDVVTVFTNGISLDGSVAGNLRLLLFKYIPYK